MIKILVRNPTYKLAEDEMYRVTRSLLNKGVLINRLRRSIGNLCFETDKCTVVFISEALDIRGIKVDAAYGFTNEECLYLTRGKSDIPTISLVDYICELEKGENND